MMPLSNEGAMSCQNNGIISRFVLCAALALSVGIPPSLAFSQANKTSPASMKGVLLIQWSDETRFIYVSPADNPLRFTTRIGREVKPGRMYTDGGSIPRVFWSVKGFSPWGYGPAYVLHDWLYHQHRCLRDSPPNKFSFEEANEVLDDAIAFLMVTKKVDSNRLARRLIKWAVNNFGQAAWDESCDAEPPAEAKGLVAPITVDRIEFSN
jgi:hypothetical protein